MFGELWQCLVFFVFLLEGPGLSLEFVLVLLGCLLSCLLANTILSAKPKLPVHFKTSPKLSDIKLFILYFV